MRPYVWVFRAAIHLLGSGNATVRGSRIGVARVIVTGAAVNTNGVLLQTVCRLGFSA